MGVAIPKHVFSIVSQLVSAPQSDKDFTCLAQQVQRWTSCTGLRTRRCSPPTGASWDGLPPCRGRRTRPTAASRDPSYDRSTWGSLKVAEPRLSWYEGESWVVWMFERNSENLGDSFDMVRRVNGGCFIALFIPIQSVYLPIERLVQQTNMMCLNSWVQMHEWVGAIELFSMVVATRVGVTFLFHCINFYSGGTWTFKMNNLGLTWQQVDHS